jgi:hypothetical protein
MKSPTRRGLRRRSGQQHSLFFATLLLLLHACIVPAQEPTPTEVTQALRDNSIAVDRIWSSQPASPATLIEIGNWTDVDDTIVNFELQNEGLVVISYAASVLANTPPLPGGEFAGNVYSDILGMRVVVDGIATRQSGSHTNPMTSLEMSTGTLVGHVVIELHEGNHTAVLQWKRWGSWVRSWSVISSAVDGVSTGRSLFVKSQHKYLWYEQPLVPARINEVSSLQAK